MTCPGCAGTGIKLNPQVYVEWGNPNSGTLPLTTTCDCVNLKTEASAHFLAEASAGSKSPDQVTES